VKLYFLLARRVPPVPSQIVLEVSEILRCRGFRVESGIAEEMLVSPDRLASTHDLYLLESYTALSLSLAGVLHAEGARLLNPYPGCFASRDKIVASKLLYTAGIPAPRCWVTADLKLLDPIVEETPLIVKPHIGWRDERIHIVRNRRELAAIPQPQTPLLIQEYFQGTGEDLRMYIAGDQVFAARKRFSSASFAEPGRPCAVSSELRDIALRCGRAFGLGLYSMDVIETPDGPKVVDVHDFPSYKGVPDAAVAVADYIERFATRWCSLQPPEMVVPNGTVTHAADQQACSSGPTRVLTEHRLPKPATSTI
jgi:ribosomal protein S6--L-glutamate ligase